MNKDVDVDLSWNQYIHNVTTKAKDTGLNAFVRQPTKHK